MAPPSVYQSTEFTFHFYISFNPGFPYVIYIIIVHREPMYITWHSIDRECPV